MSKIKEINIDSNLSICLFSGVFISKNVDDYVLNFFNSYCDKFIGIEIFDMELIDGIIKNYCNNNLLSISKIFLELGALELGCPIYKYIGNCNEIPKIIYDDCEVFNIDEFTVTDIIKKSFDSSFIFYSNDLIVCDLAIGLGISFIKTDNDKVIKKLDFLSRMM